MIANPERATPLAYWSLFVAALGGLMQSYVGCIIAGALPILKSVFGLSDAQEGLIASIVLFGALIGVSLAGTMADHWGRRKSFRVSAVLFFLTGLGSFFVDSVPLLLTVRFVQGAAVGIVSILIPLYLAEIAPPARRGAFVTTYVFSVAVGTLVAYWIGFVFTPSANWRAMLSLVVIPAVIQYISLFFIPESPKWLIGQGRIAEGKAVLYRLQSGAEERVPKQCPILDGNWRDLLSPTFRNVMILGLVLSIFQQLSGINAILYYTPKIFQKAGFNGQNGAMVSTLLVGILNVLATFCSFFLVDKWGRRKLILYSICGVVLSLGAMVAVFLVNHGSLATISVIAVLLFVGIYAVGVGPVTWVFIAEIYPLYIRAKAIAVMTFFSWLANALVILTFPSLLGTFGASMTFGFFGICSLGALIYYIPTLIETKGKTLEEIEAIVLRKKGE